GRARLLRARHPGRSRARRADRRGRLPAHRRERGREPRLGRGERGNPGGDRRGLDGQLGPPREHPPPRVPRDRRRAGLRAAPAGVGPGGGVHDELRRATGRPLRSGSPM
ncbi:MAG: hypothetical protein AVDCRST_MAG45-1415, partial [uncultured Solirubrobacterales bacterium]